MGRLHPSPQHSEAFSTIPNTGEGVGPVYGFSLTGFAGPHEPEEALGIKRWGRRPSSLVNSVWGSQLWRTTTGHSESMMS